jgi:putative phosphoesterase
MKIALLGDIHANLPALEATLCHAGQNGADAIWNAGDLIGYGAFPNEVISILRREKAVSIIGNYDVKILAQDGGKPGAGRRPGSLDQAGAMQWAYASLSGDNLAYLKSLPENVRMLAGDKRVLLIHGSPDSRTEYLDLWTPWRRFVEIAKTAEADIIISGHSHRPMVKMCGYVWFVNTGSVGRPDDGDPRACYAILETDGPVKVTHYRVRYDIDRAAAAIRRNRLPEEYAQMIIVGRSLEYVMNARRISMYENSCA